VSPAIATLASRVRYEISYLSESSECPALTQRRSNNRHPYAHRLVTRHRPRPSHAGTCDSMQLVETPYYRALDGYNRPVVGLDGLGR
jgi:hypothetical protein